MSNQSLVDRMGIILKLIPPKMIWKDIILMRFNRHRLNCLMNGHQSFIREEKFHFYIVYIIKYSQYVGDKGTYYNQRFYKIFYFFENATKTKPTRHFYSWYQNYYFTNLHRNT